MKYPRIIRFEVNGTVSKKLHKAMEGLNPQAYFLNTGFNRLIRYASMADSLENNYSLRVIYSERVVVAVVDYQKDCFEKLNAGFFD